MLPKLVFVTIQAFIINAKLAQQTLVPHEENRFNDANDFFEKSTESLLKPFGLTSSIIKSEEKRQPHKFMEYIYKTYGSMYEKGLPLLADTVRGCTDLGETHRRLADFPYVAYKFDIPKIQPTETLIKTELKVLIKFSDFNIVNSNRSFLKFSLFGVLTRTKSDDQKYPLLLELATKAVPNLNERESAWISFEVTSFLLALQESRKRYAKFVLKIKSIYGGSTIPPVMVGAHYHQENVTEKSLLVLFSTDSKNKENVKAANSRPKRGLTSIEDSILNKKVKKNNRKKTENKKKKCRRKNMRVHFRDLRWNSWLMSPSDYNGYYCHGSCTYPLTDKPDNHATIQSIMHKLNNKIVGPPCCVPTEYEKLPVLHLFEGKTIFRLIEGFIVKSCGCK